MAMRTADLRDDITRHLEGRPVSAPPYFPSIHLSTPPVDAITADLEPGSYGLYEEIPDGTSEADNRVAAASRSRLHGRRIAWAA